MIPKRYLLVLSTFLLSLLLYVDRICISAAKGPITTDLGLSKEQFGWAMSVFALGYALCQTPGGRLADRFGPRRMLAAVVVFWSLFTGLTGAVRNYVSLLITRLLFGAGEAGAFPGIARATYSWIPMAERGVVQGINFSASRFGGAAALWLMPVMISRLGWRESFVVLMVVGFVWAVCWYAWFRDDPTEHPRITKTELDYILATRQQGAAAEGAAKALPVRRLVASGNLWLISAQYFCSNFTFFFCLTWLFPHMEESFHLTPMMAGVYSSIPLIFGALGNAASGLLVDRIYRSGKWVLSRRVPAMVGFLLAAGGLVASVYALSPLESVLYLSLAIFGADMTLSPSWSFCIDIGRRHAGVVSGTMNMAGNIGSFVTALAFPYLAGWTGSNVPFFFVAAGLNLAAIAAWLFVRPDRPLEDV